MSSRNSIASTKESLEPMRDNGLQVWGKSEGLENIYDYDAGGHHPVHLDDLLGQNYKVLQKLRSGDYANVWLCIDTSGVSPRYVAVKISWQKILCLIALNCTSVNKLVELGLSDGPFAEHFCLPLCSFNTDGPNGQHFGFVYPVLGPRVSRLLKVARSPDPGKVLGRVCF